MVTQSIKQLKDLKIAIIGIGRIFSRHYESLKQLDLLDNIVALCDTDPNKLNEASKLFNKPYNMYWDYKTINCKDINLAIILTPNGEHFPMSKHFLSNGVNVICEKPAVFFAEQLDDLYAESALNNCRFFNVFQNRYNPPVLKLREAIQQGRFGKILHVKASCLWARPNSYYQLAEWRGKQTHMDGAIYNQTIHTIDLPFFVTNSTLGPIEFVRNNNLAHENIIETDDCGLAFFYMYDKKDNPIETTIDISTNCFQKDIEAKITVIGTKGQAIIGGTSFNKVIEWRFNEVKGEDSFIDNNNTNPTDVYGFSHTTFYNDVLVKGIVKNKPTLADVNVQEAYKLCQKWYNAK